MPENALLVMRAESPETFAVAFNLDYTCVCGSLMHETGTKEQVK